MLLFVSVPAMVRASASGGLPEDCTPVLPLRRRLHGCTDLSAAIKLARFAEIFSRGPRSNAMIRHPIRAAARTAVSRTACWRRRIGKQGLSNAAPRRHVAVCGRNSIVWGRHRPTPDQMPGRPARIGIRPADGTH
jgi:hypothetical protein